MSTQNHDHDRLVARLRAGLDEFTSSVRQDPPDLGVPTAAATESLGGGGGRGRWMTTAAASIFAVAAIGSVIWVAGDADAPSSTQPAATTTATNEILGADTPVSSNADAAIFYDDPNAPRILPLYSVDGTLTVAKDCVVLQLADGKVRVPVWPENVLWTGEAMLFADGTAIRVDQPFKASAGAGVVRSDDKDGWARCRAATNAEDDVWIVGSGPIASQPGDGTPASSLPSAPDTTNPNGTVRAIATVLENGEHGPQVCGAVAESFPPQCGGADITNWDWSTVTGDESANGTRWGEYVIVGTYNADGTEFTLSESARTPTAADREQPASDPDFSTPCAEPEGGWNSPYPDETLDESVVRRDVKAYGGMWIDESTGVYNVKIVGDKAAREAAQNTIEAVYSGPICVVEGTHTMRELTRIQRAVERVSDPRIVSIGTDVLTGQVQVSLTASAPELEARFVSRYGDAVSFEHLAQPAGGSSQPSLGEATASTAAPD
jgi:hypothetical protein